jgi:riboflavin kinase/FMN adenylyltransferase
MQVHRSIDELSPFKNAVITIGTFDGVHQGHRKIIEALKNEARKAKGESVIITFNPHPRKILNRNENLHLINTLDEKIMLLDETDIDHLVIVPFTREFADQPADDYMKNFLISKFHPHTIIIGYDHHFGKDRQGNFRLLEKEASIYGYHLKEIPKYILDEVAVSSTKIRKALSDSDVDTANKLLGYEFFFEGSVIKGDQLGRQLGYPTANLLYNDADKIHLGHGVYAVRVLIKNQWLKGMLSIGNRPTLDQSDERIEVNIFDWNDEIYGETIKIVVSKYLRPQEKYPTLEMLVQQLEKDKKKSLEIL